MPRNILPEAAEKGTFMTPEMERLRQEVAAAVAGLTEEQLSWHPPGKWCAAEVFEHLYLSYTGTIRGFERLERVGHPLGTSATWRQRGITLMVVWLRYLPSGGQSPAVARPRGLAREKVMGEIGQKIAEMDEAIRRSEESHGTRVKLLDHPILGPLTGPEWKRLHLVHGRHHLKQIRELRERATRAS